MQPLLTGLWDSLPFRRPITWLVGNVLALSYFALFFLMVEVLSSVALLHEWWHRWQQRGQSSSQACCMGYGSCTHSNGGNRA